MQRNIWVDNLKAFGILAVILGHISSPFGTFIYSWHMPLFFIISGFFIRALSSGELLCAVKKDFKRLMIPYFVFAIIGIATDTLKRYLLHRDVLDYMHEFYGVFVSMDMQSLMNTYAFVLWFLPTLFFAKLLYRGLTSLIPSLFMSFASATLLFAFSFFIELPFALDNACNALLFIFIGNLVFKYRESPWLYGATCIIGVIFLFYGIPELDMASKNYTSVLINILWATSVVVLLVKIFMKLPLNNAFLASWGGGKYVAVYYSPLHK
ncbi:MAG: acyltransferase family protein [Wolinella sp.]